MSLFTQLDAAWRITAYYSVALILTSLLAKLVSAAPSRLIRPSAQEANGPRRLAGAQLLLPNAA